MDNLNEILEKSKSLNDLSRCFFKKVNYNCAEKSKKILEENGINWKEWLENKKRKPNICLFCGKELTGRNRFIKKFCNSSCAASYNNKMRDRKKKKNEKKQNTPNIVIEKRYCINCGNLLKKRQKNFCSRSCSLDYEYIEYIKRWENGEENGLKGEYGISRKIRRFLKEKITINANYVDGEKLTHTQEMYH